VLYIYVYKDNNVLKFSIMDTTQVLQSR